ncbi:uncharacterized protein F4807DRAFT_407140 [Annulohypoxylon truncatum]|uniref:uncharacterized protein n=1 Tax=Annulohypoxylon truncatum TaxID=327061 RepID=UPI002007DF9A|nr:uncharacterized protein F4807DRAFT_407140 [Annulohypoxylon truncatum]KAI1214231.1 hypothetical protein F4807DRAFT_407140 [Annulohypoxylon truncatum]
MAITTKATACRVMDTTGFDIHIFIPSKYIPNPGELNDILTSDVGKGEFELEMRHNVYNIKSKAKLTHGTIQKIRGLSNATSNLSSKRPATL